MDELIALLLNELLLNNLIDFFPSVFDIWLPNWFNEWKIDGFFCFVFWSETGVDRVWALSDCFIVICFWLELYCWSPDPLCIFRLIFPFGWTAWAFCITYDEVLESNYVYIFWAKSFGIFPPEIDAFVVLGFIWT